MPARTSGHDLARRVLALWLAWAGACTVGASELPPPPIAITTAIEVDGRAVAIDGAITLGPMQAPGSGMQATALIDLGNVVAALHAGMLRRLPRERCKRRAADNWVARMRRYSVSVEGGQLMIEVGLEVEVWACLQWHGNELRRRIADGRVYARLPLRLEVADDGMRLHAGRPQVDAYGPLGDIARVYFAARGVEIGQLLETRMAAFNARQHAFPIPALWLHQGKLRSARFVDGGRPSIEIVAELQPALPGWARRLLGRGP
jgi:hypothetical protein